MASDRRRYRGNRGGGAKKAGMAPPASSSHHHTSNDRYYESWDVTQSDVKRVEVALNAPIASSSTGLSRAEISRIGAVVKERQDEIKELMIQINNAEAVRHRYHIIEHVKSSFLNR